MYALVEFKGKQYKAEKGAVLKVDKVDAEPGSSLDIDHVLLLSGDTVTVGTPYVAGAKVTATVQAAGKDEEGKDLSYGKDKKIVVFKYMPKKDYRRKQGHRQRYSLLKVEDIVTA
jgi:large subunit ribosomal protein L21